MIPKHQVGNAQLCSDVEGEDRTTLSTLVSGLPRQPQIYKATVDPIHVACFGRIQSRQESTL